VPAARDARRRAPGALRLAGADAAHIDGDVDSGGVDERVGEQHRNRDRTGEGAAVGPVRRAVAIPGRRAQAQLHLIDWRRCVVDVEREAGAVDAGAGIDHRAAAGEHGRAQQRGRAQDLALRAHWKVT
jgi:hypothetical protein